MNSFKSFNLKKALLNALTTNEILLPTEIQTQCIPPLLKNKDIIALSPTGTGKTLAFAIPILNSVIKTNSYFHSLIITPTRDLALQTYNTFMKFGNEFGLRVLCLIGGEDEKKQKEGLFKSPHIIIGTPGRMHFILKRIKLFNNLRYIIIDECDLLATDSYEKDVITVLENAKSNTIGLFTATMSERVEKIARHQKDPLRVGAVESKIKSSLDQRFILVGQKYKESYLYHILRTTNQSTIVFVSSCLGAQTISLFLNKMGISTTSLYGDLSLEERKASLESFRQDECIALVATDLASRGLDIPTVGLIINFDLTKVRDYTHRVGRTARYDKTGVSISFVTQYDIETFQRLENDTETKMKEYFVVKQEVLDSYDRVRVVFHEAYNEIKEKCGDRNAKKRRKK